MFIYNVVGVYLWSSKICLYSAYMQLTDAKSKYSIKSVLKLKESAVYYQVLQL